DVWHTRDEIVVYELLSDGVIVWNVEEWEHGEHLAHCLGPLLPRARAPEIVHPEEAALEEIFTQAGRFERREPDGADIRPDQKWALEQRIVSQVNGPVARVAVGVLADPRFGELGRPDHQIQPGVGIIRRPAETVRFPAVAGVHQFAYGEGAVAEVGRRHVERHSGA